METIILKIHSTVDLITNSSTEMYTLDEQRDLAIVEEIIREKEREYPSDYGRRVHIAYAETHDINRIFEYQYNEEEVSKYLRMLGYTVEKKENPQRFIIISCERGYIDYRLQQFIETTFKVIDHGADY